MKYISETKKCVKNLLAQKHNGTLKVKNITYITCRDGIYHQISRNFDFEIASEIFDL